MAEPPVDYQISAADAHELAGAVLLPADLRRQVLEKMAAQRDLAAMLDLFAQGNPVRTCVGHAKAMKQDATQ
ncbi:hypothetical protein MW371_004366 [Pseudomonas aeruginosa]|nr:hypothetical protein [Pseudomonas aeruginosa]